MSKQRNLKSVLIGGVAMASLTMLHMGTALAADFKEAPQLAEKVKAGSFQVLKKDCQSHLW